MSNKKIPTVPAAVVAALGMVALLGVTQLLAADAPPTVSLQTPADGSTSTQTNVAFTCQGTDDVGLTEAQLWYGRNVVATKQFRQDGSVAGATDDAQITADTPTTNTGAAVSVKVDGLSPHSHVLLKYPNLFGSANEQVPPGAEIQSAQLTVNCFNAGNTISAYRLLEDWVESEATWNQRQSSVAWGNVGADGAVSRDTAGISWSCATVGLKTFDLTSMVQQWSSGAPNYGIVIVETGQDGVEWYSSENTTVANRPLLTVQYQALEGWGNQQTQPVSGASAAATFNAALQDLSEYIWNCQFTDTTSQTSFAPANFTLAVNTAWTPPAAPDPNLKVAFFGDQGLNANSRAVLQLVEDEGAHMVLQLGDFDYADNPAAWDQQTTDILGADFPYFAVIGNHDLTQWTGYQQKLSERLARVTGATCTVNLGVQAACRYRGLHFLTVAPGVTGSGHDLYLRDQLAGDNSIWSICAWHKNQRLIQVGDKADETGWGVYEECRKGGGLVATAHEHSYERTHLLSSFQTQTIASTASTLVLEKNKSLAFVSGMGGQSIRPQSLSGAWWASIYTSTQGATYGALFCTFNVDGDPGKADCYFKNINGQVVDQFELRSATENYGNRSPIAAAGADLTVNDADNSGAEAVSVNGSTSYDLDGTISTYEWREGTTVLGTAATLAADLAVGTHTLVLTVTDNAGATDTDTVVITVTPYQPPTITKQFRQGIGTAGTTDDAQLTADQPNNNSGAATFVKVDGLSPHSHAVIKYPDVFGTGADQVPLGAQIVSATLTVNCYNAGNTLTAYRLLEDWTETHATWNRRTNGVNWGNPGADGTISRDTAGINWDCLTIGVKTFDLTAIVQQWSAGVPNFGVVVRETGNDGVEWYSSEHTTLTNRPLLTVTYR